MPLSVGDKLGPYEILAPIGAGGMGEVYRARDTKLDREVAIKVLPAALAQDPERLTRFEREAKVLASLNHPNIATIYGVEESAGVRALVMELVPGAPLKCPLVLETALNCAKQIADALEAAHDQGIVHRDLKPANIMITPAGVVKLLDFGLAAVAQPSPANSGDPDNSPTLTMGATQAGMILGTAGYMSPEQAAGQHVDKRADIWSYGVVLYELLVGQRLFYGPSVAHILADVLRGPIDFDKLPRETPGAVCDLVKRCLDRDVKTRLRDIGEARIAVQNVGKEADLSSITPSQSGFRWVAWGVVGLLLVVLSFLAFVHFREPAPETGAPVVFQIVAPDKRVINGLSVSPDGRHVAFTARSDSDGRTNLWVRSLGAAQARSLGVEGLPGSAFWSPDSRFIGFAMPGSRNLAKVEVGGGPAETICSLCGGNFRGATWNVKGDILFSTVGSYGVGRASLSRVPAVGGTPSPVTLIDRAESHQIDPFFLPDGRHFLYLQTGPAAARSGIFVGSLDAKPEQQDARRLLAADRAAYVPPAAGESSGVGHLLFERDGILMAQPFDPRRLEFRGDAYLVVREVSGGPTPGWSVSPAGVLAFQVGHAETPTTHLVWRDRQGKSLGEVGPPSNYTLIQLSFDGKRIGVNKVDEQAAGATHSWVADVARPVFTRVSTAGVRESSASISVDGRVAFSSTANGAAGDIYVSQVNGVGIPELWVKSDAKPGIVQHPNGFSADGRFLIYDVHDPQRRQDLWVVPTTGKHKPIPFLATSADQTFGQFSPDGKWVAYDSDESGRREVYVQGFAPDRSPAASVGKWTISSVGGSKPRWSHNGRELFYLSPDGKLMAVPVKLGNTFEPGVAVPLFEVRASGFFPYDVSPDGRFLINTPLESEARDAPITVIVNWPKLLEKGAGEK